MITFDESYTMPATPQEVRDDFASLTEEYGMDPQDLLRSVVATLPASQLAEIIDDLLTGRI